MLPSNLARDMIRVTFVDPEAYTSSCMSNSACLRTLAHSAASSSAGLKPALSGLGAFELFEPPPALSRFGGSAFFRRELPLRTGPPPALSRFGDPTFFRTDLPLPLSGAPAVAELNRIVSPISDLKGAPAKLNSTFGPDAEPREQLRAVLDRVGEPGVPAEPGANDRFDWDREPGVPKGGGVQEQKDASTGSGAKECINRTPPLNEESTLYVSSSASSSIPPSSPPSIPCLIEPPGMEGAKFSRASWDGGGKISLFLEGILWVGWGGWSAQTSSRPLGFARSF